MFLFFNFFLLQEQTERAVHPDCEFCGIVDQVIVPRQTEGVLFPSKMAFKGINRFNLNLNCVADCEWKEYSYTMSHNIHNILHAICCLFFSFKHVPSTTFPGNVAVILATTHLTSPNSRVDR